MGLENICQGCRSGTECEQKEIDPHSKYDTSNDNKNYGRYDQGQDKKKRQYRF